MKSVIVGLFGGVAILGCIAFLSTNRVNSTTQQEAKKLTQEEVSTRVTNGCRINERSGDGYLSCLCSAAYVNKKLGYDGLLSYMYAQEERNLKKVMEIISLASGGNDWDRFNSVHMCVMRIKMEAQTGYRTF